MTMARRSQPVIASLRQEIAHPARNGGDVGVEQRRHHHAAADLLSDAGVAIRLGVDVCRPPRFEQRALVRRTAGHRQVAERAPDFIPRHLAVAVVLEAGGAHGHRFHAFVRVLVLLRKDGLQPRIQLLERHAVGMAQRPDAHGMTLSFRGSAGGRRVAVAVARVRRSAGLPRCRRGCLPMRFARGSRYRRQRVSAPPASMRRPHLRAPALRQAPGGWIAWPCRRCRPGLVSTTLRDDPKPA